MIISASRRTDIPAYYSDWFFNRLSEGFAHVRNPANPGQIREVSLRPQDVDGIIFWSKNPAPMIERLGELSAYRYYFQFTLTPYGHDIEPGLPEKTEIVETFMRLSSALGPERMIWRYDPILLNPAYTAERHAEDFERLAAALKGFTAQCTISFIDLYKNTNANAGKLNLTEMDDEAKLLIAKAFARIAGENNMALSACAEEIDLSQFGIGRARCVDAGLFNTLWGLNLPERKDRNQRPACRCTESVDIGAYNTCPAGCLYCYANYNPKAIQRNIGGHEPKFSMIVK